MSDASTSSAPDGRRPGADLCGIAGHSADDLCRILAEARSLIAAAELGVRAPKLLDGCTVLNVFNEPSTRTRVSFEIAAKRLGADVVTFAVDASSSSAKGETLRDTFRNLDAMGVDAFVVRDRTDGLPDRVCQWVRGRVVNAGDGCLEHPTQALLDTLTICEQLGRPFDGTATLSGLRVAICGDVDHGRVALSDMLAFKTLGAEVHVAGPSELASEATAETYDVPLHRELDSAIAGAHVVIMLRIQRERLYEGPPMPTPDAYHATWGLTEHRESLLADGAIVMHPGPMNRGIEIADTVADGARSRVLRQVTLGVATRMAVLARACGVEVPGA